MIQHRPSPQYATLDVYNPFETREVRLWAAQDGREGEDAPVSPLLRVQGTSLHANGLSPGREASLPWLA